MKVDPHRRKAMERATGIYVRAQDEGSWEAVDVATLDAESFEAFVATKDRQWILDALRLALGYPVWPVYEGIKP